MALVESTYLVNSFHAVDAATGEVIAADDKGVINLTNGQKVIFVNAEGKQLRVQYFTIEAMTDVKVAINDNELYPWRIPKDDMRGLTNVSINSFTALADCSLYYEGLSV